MTAVPRIRISRSVMGHLKTVALAFLLLAVYVVVRVGLADLARLFRA